MQKVHANSAVRLLGAVLMSGSIVTSQASDTHFSAPQSSALESGKSVMDGSSFADHVRVTLNESVDITSFIQSINLPAFESVSGSFDDLAAAADYRLPGSQAVRQDLTGAVDQSEINAQAVGEPDALIMLLGAIGVVLYQLHRKQRSLEQRPLSTISGI